MTSIENRFEKYYVIDTNIILQDAHLLMTLSDNSQNLVIIPETVLDELDAKKSGYDEINYQARQFGRLLGDAEVLSMNSVSGDYKIIELKINHGHNVRVDIISKEMYKAETKSIASNILNDRKILEIAKFAQDHYSDPESPDEDRLTFLSLDIMARTRALSLKINNDTLQGNKDTAFDYSFHKTLQIDTDYTPDELDGKSIEDLDPEFKPYNFSYTIQLPNGRSILVAIHNRHISLLDEDEVRRQAVSPKNKEQLFFSNAILDDRYKILAVDAKAGCVTKDTKITIRYK
jgi:PhoH-like ATPase